MTAILFTAQKGLKMENKFIRSDMLFGEGSSDVLKRKKVAVFGIGGVGGICAEALVRSGVGTIEVIDNDTVSVSNINRQIVATEKTVGMLKTPRGRKKLTARRKSSKETNFSFPKPRNGSILILTITLWTLSTPFRENSA